MDHSDRIVQAVEAVAKELLAALAAHEEWDHAGEPCGRAKVTAVGYIAARLGIGTEGEMMLAGYWRKEFQRRMEQEEKARAIKCQS